MKVVIQIVDEAAVTIDGKEYSRIGKGYLLLVGVGEDDTKSDIDAVANKLIGLRIFEDAAGKTNLSLQDVDGEILSVSQFTLLADCSHGRRPSFIHAAPPQMANELYEYFNSLLESLSGKTVKTGVFGADMKVSLVNNGPFTILLDSRELMK